MQQFDPSGEYEARARNGVEAMLRARSIAVIGASDKPESFGGNVVTQLVETGFSGRLYPVNPRYESVAGVPCFAGLADVPEPVDCAVLAVSDERLETALESAAGAGARSAVIFGSAFEAERPGRAPLTARLAAIAHQARIAVCGSNCMGFLNLADRICVGGWPYRPLPQRGPIGFITHSGSSYSAFALNQRQLAMSHLISAGQEIATTAADYMHFLLSRPEVRVIGCILETARDPENFIAALERADRKGVPVVVLKLGRSAAGGKMARAHSGALAGSDAAYRAVFERHNVLAVRTVNELADTLELLACPRASTTSGVALATDSGGERTLIVDLAAEMGLSLATLTAETTERLAETLDPGLAPVNPVDAWGTGHDHERIMRTCLQALAEDPNVGQVVLASNMLSGRPLLHTWGRVAEAVHRATAKPVVVMGHLTPAFDREEAARLRGVGVPVLLETFSGLSALAANARWHRRRADGRKPAGISQRHAQAAHLWRERIAASGKGSLDTAESLALAAAFGIPVAPSRPACSLDEAVTAAEALGYPVVLKTLAPGVDHKFDRGGVVLGVLDRASLTQAYATMAEKLGGRVLVQRQADEGVEILVGMTNDEQFGSIVTIGLGGVFVEVFADTTTLLPPVERDEVLEHLSRLKGFPLLQGARGRPATDLPALADLIVRFSQLAATMGSAVAEMDMNPVIAGPGGCVAVDALVVPKP